MRGIAPEEVNVEHTGHRWQKEVAEFLKKIRPSLVVETGVSEGVSTKFFLAALDEIGHGRLVSIDPCPAYTTPHPRWTLVRDTSLNALGPIYLENGPFDVFVHDADHDVECQTADYAIAWGLVKPGGYILSDDYSWGNHGAWPRFCDAHGLMSATMGYAAWVQKPLNGPQPPTPAELETVIDEAWKLSHAAAADQGDAPRYFRSK